MANAREKTRFMVREGLAPMYEHPCIRYSFQCVLAGLGIGMYVQFWWHGTALDECMAME